MNHTVLKLAFQQDPVCLGRPYQVQITSNNIAPKITKANKSLQHNKCSFNLVVFIYSSKSQQQSPQSPSGQTWVVCSRVWGSWENQHLKVRGHNLQSEKNESPVRVWNEWGESGVKETKRQIATVSAVMWILYGSAVVKREQRAISPSFYSNLQSKAVGSN